jgi:hypothetical protein
MKQMRGDIRLIDDQIVECTRFIIEDTHILPILDNTELKPIKFNRLKCIWGLTINNRLSTKKIHDTLVNFFIEKKK